MSESNKNKGMILWLDFMCLCGLGMLGTGLWWYDPKISMIVMGVILFLLALWMSALIAEGKRKSKG